jgi:hypothetical protein
MSCRRNFAASAARPFSACTHVNSSSYNCETVTFTIVPLKSVAPAL